MHIQNSPNNAGILLCYTSIGSRGAFSLSHGASTFSIAPLRSWYQLELTSLQDNMKYLGAQIDSDLQLRNAQARIQAIHSTVDEEQAVTRGVLQEAQQRGVLIDELKRDLASASAENEVHRQDYEQ